MCGVAGLIDKKGTDITSQLFAMMENIQHRGPDAAGIAVFSEDTKVLLRVSSYRKEQHSLFRETVERFATILDEKLTGERPLVRFLELQLQMKAEDMPALHAAVNAIDGVAVHSLGEGFRVYKDGGLLTDLTAQQTIERPTATHGIGHVRMATESVEDINAAHPFVSPFYPELAIVHNGQFTNYFNMRRFLEDKGVCFQTMNDSEAAAHLIAYAMRENGGDLQAALEFAQSKMDGIFCIIAATPTQMGFCKDKMGIKPLLLLETEDLVLLGSEQIEFTAIVEDAFAEEMAPGEVRVWNI